MATPTWPYAAALAFGMMHGMSTAAPTRAERLQWQALANHLQLSAEQLQTLIAQRAALQADLQSMAAQAQKPAPGPDTELCQRARQRVADHRQAMQGLLGPAQRERLQGLEQAFALMPMVEAAQAAGLMTDRLALTPAGLPAGAITVDHAWQRVLAPALPGCQDMGTRVVRELDQPDGGPPRKPSSP